MTNHKSAAQTILEAMTPLTTAQLEEIHAEFERMKAADGGRLRDEAARMVHACAIDALEIRDPAHPIVRATIAELEAAFNA